MDRKQAISNIKDLFSQEFDRGKFISFSGNLLNLRSTDYLRKSIGVFDSYNQHVSSLELVARFSDGDNNIDVLIVTLVRDTSLDKARTMQRNFVARYLSENQSDAALVAFVSPRAEDWRFSLIKMDYKFKATDAGLKVEQETTPAKRWSFLVGKNENSHTAQSQLVDILANDELAPMLEELEQAFSIETVTNEFFAKYADLFLRMKEELDLLLENDSALKADFEAKEIDTADFAKKTMGQMAFMYFLQKKGWFGVAPGKEWGSGVKNFLRVVFERREKYGKNFFDDVLEPLFYEALAQDRGNEAIYPKLNNCRMPFLNGGLFEPMNGYSWETTHIRLPDELFSNKKETQEGDIGNGILDVFDRYNFTVNESDPLEQEVAVDPEMLGKVFENLLEIKDRKSKGAFYTPREIVHHMCKESLINYLYTKTTDFISRIDIELFIKQGSQISQNNDLLPQSIISHAKELDDLLANIKVCDPAVGSGAFPLGMLNEISKARYVLARSLSNNLTMYQIKLHAISNSIYGVDIDPGAVEIAKLRFWLSLVVEEKSPSPLPNLEHKIMQGDSLISQYEGIKLFNNALLLDEETINSKIEKIKEELSSIQSEYFYLSSENKINSIAKREFDSKIRNLQQQMRRLSSKNRGEEIVGDLFDSFDSKEEERRNLALLQSKIAQFFREDRRSIKDRLKDDIDHLKWDLIESSLIDKGDSENLQNIKKLRKNRVKPFFVWKLEFSEVFKNNGGFDIVIGNPPYVSALDAKKVINPSIRDQYKKTYRSAQGAYDLYVLFFELGLNLLKPTGALNLITPSKFLSASYAKSLRELILENSLIKISDFSSIKVFESANVSTISTLIKKEKVLEDVTVETFNSLSNFQDFRVTSSKRGYLEYFPENIWGFILSDGVDILLKIISKSTTVQDIASVNASSTAAEADEYSGYIQSKNCSNCIKFINTGTIDKFKHLWGEKKLKNKDETILHPYLNLDNVSLRRRDMYQSPKLIFKKLAKKITSTYDEFGEFASTNTNFVFNPTNNYSLAFLAVFMNSSLMNFLYKQLFGGLSMVGSYQFQAPQIRVLPVPHMHLISNQNMLDLIEDIEKRGVEAIDNALIEAFDKEIYKIYGLTENEIKVISNCSP